MEDTDEARQFILQGIFICTGEYKALCAGRWWLSLCVLGGGGCVCVRWEVAVACVYAFEMAVACVYAGRWWNTVYVGMGLRYNLKGSWLISATGSYLEGNNTLEMACSVTEFVFLCRLPSFIP